MAAASEGPRVQPRPMSRSESKAKQNTVTSARMTHRSSSRADAPKTASPYVTFNPVIDQVRTWRRMSTRTILGRPRTVIERNLHSSRYPSARIDRTTEGTGGHCPRNRRGRCTTQHSKPLRSRPPRLRRAHITPCARSVPQEATASTKPLSEPCHAWNSPHAGTHTRPAAADQECLSAPAPVKSSRAELTRASRKA